MTNSALPPDLAATRIINAAGTLTRLSGARVSPRVAAAMAEAAGQSFDMWTLQAAASERLAAATGAEAGLVTTGASAGLTLAAAAVIAGMDAGHMDRLPTTTGMPHEIIIPRTHRNAYDRALRVAGAKIIDVGVADRETGAGIRGLEAWEVEAAIGPMTVAIAASASNATERDLPMLADVAGRNGLKLIVDAAAQLPPRENLKRFIALGASLVVFSGGKAIGGPQASGLLVGERALIASAALQMLDMDVRPEAFAFPPAFFARLDVCAVPRHGLGRGFKASKEAIVGLLVALDEFLAADGDANVAQISSRITRIAAGLTSIGGVIATTVPGRPGALPRLEIAVDPAICPIRPAIARLASNGVHVAEGRIADGILIVDLIAVTEDDDAHLLDALRAALKP